MKNTKSIVIRKSHSWTDIEEAEPDDIDLQMLQEIEKDPDCKSFLSFEDVTKELQGEKCFNLS